MAVEKKISGVTYRFEELVGWDAWDAFDLFVDVVGPLFPVLDAADAASADATAEDGIERVRTAGKSIFTVLPDVLRQHNKQAARDLFSLLIKGCRANGQMAEIGVHPQKLDDMVQVFAFCLRGQFENFFGGEGVGALLSLVDSKRRS